MECFSCSGSVEQAAHRVRVDDDMEVIINQAFQHELDGEGKPADRGIVVLRIVNPEVMKNGAGCGLDAFDALLLANRLVRAANLVLEAGGGVSDAEHECLRHYRAARIAG